MLLSGRQVAAVVTPRRSGSGRRSCRVSCIAAPERPAGTSSTVRSLPAPTQTTDRASTGRQASAAPSRAIVKAPAQPVPVTRKQLSRREFDWSNESYNPKTRSAKIWAFALTLQARLWLLDKKWSYPGGFTAEKEVLRRRRLAAWIRGNLLELGPTFIKLGQLFSARSDLLPKEVTEELSLLQDQVPAFSFEKASSIIREDFGGSGPDELFAYFDPQPLAAASLGQVHYAQLKSGQQVVVKVQRPGLKQLFEIDLATLKDIAAALDKQDSSREFKSIAEECSVILLEEIDYILEGRNADRFRRDFAPYSWIRVPTVYWRFTSPRVVTLEYMPGVKISDKESHLANNLDPKQLAKYATEAYLIQILKTGFFHADPHPGNVAVDTQGRLVYYDFGMMGKVETLTRERLTDLFYAIYKKDTDKVLELLVELKILVPTQDVASVKRAIAFFLTRLGEQTQRQDTISAVGEDLFTIAVDQPFRFPATFTFVLRAFGTLEGIGAALDSDFSFAKVAQPYASELLNLQDRAEQRRFALEELQKQVGAVSLAAASMPQRVERSTYLLERLEAGDIRLRVRTLEVERAARRQSVMQGATLNAIAAAGLLNVGTQLALAGAEIPAQAALGSALLFSGIVLRDYFRVERLDEFEKGIKGRGGGQL